MKIKKSLLSACIIAFLFVFVSCKNEKKPSRQELMDLELSQRIEAYKTKKYRECKKKFLQEVEYEVDSMMYYLVERMKGKSDEIPPRPPRPNRLVDTIELYTLDSTATISN